MATVFDRHSTLGLGRFRANRAAKALDGVFRSLLEKVGLGDGTGERAGIRRGGAAASRRLVWRVVGAPRAPLPTSCH
jgi:hypothetical protein